jgi:glycosyltransferase involved in cell wall biosynthesis
LPIVAEKINVIPCCVDVGKFNPSLIDNVKKEQLKVKLALKEKHVLGYVGSIGTWYMLQEMIMFFKAYQVHYVNAIFLFVTAENPEIIQNEARKQAVDLSRIRILSCTHQEVPMHISLFDHSVFFILPSYSKKASSPTKQGELMAMGIPLVCNANVGDSEFIVNENKSGVVVKDFESINFHEAIVSLAQISPAHFQSKTSSIFGLANGIEIYSNVYQKIHPCLLNDN